MIRTDYCGILSSKNAGKKVVLKGWVHRIRDHGGVVFLDLRDREGVVQVVFPNNISVEQKTLISSLKSEDVLEVAGIVQMRPKGLTNPKLKTGEIEVLCEEITVINRSQPLPFEIAKDVEVEESLRLKYRYLDLRRERLQENIKNRSKISKLVRDFFHDEGFIEVETPILVKNTPGGARNYLVPTRYGVGKFFALAESPQIYKQLLIIAGFDKYFQLAKCFRDEDPRADRQNEFTQIDVEMSFIQEEDIRDLVERLFFKLWQDMLNVKLKSPYKIFSYDESLEKFGTDKPDLRYDLEIKELTDYFKGTLVGFLKDSPYVGGILVKNAKKSSRKFIKEYEDFVKGIGGKGVVVVKFEPPYSTNLPVEKLKSILKAEPSDLCLIMGGEKKSTLERLGFLRKKIIEMEELKPSADFEPVWVINFPLFELDKEGNITSKHHPFTSPLEEDIPLFESNPLAIRAKAYDVVINGVEIGGGSIRIVSQEIQKKVFKTLGLSEREVEEKFSFLLKALSFGAPPHGGIALGFDRLVATILGEESMREVIAFPKMTSSYDPLTDAPSEVEPSQLKNVFIRLEE